MLRLGMLWILLFAIVGMAQEPSTQEPIPIPIQDSTRMQSVAKKSFVDDVFNNNRNPIGFSLGAFQGYSNDIPTTEEPKVGSGIAAFMPKAFFNLGRRRSRLHLDLGAGYRLYYHDHDLNSWDYYGKAEFSHQFSRRTLFRLSDQFTSSYNDSWSFVSLSSPLQYNSNISNEVLFNQQRINRNALHAELGWQATRRASFGTFCSFNSYQYPDATLGDSKAIEVGGNFDLQLTRRLYLTNNYSSYFNYYDDVPFMDNRVDHLQVGGLEFRLGDGWRIWVRAGADWAHQSGNNGVSENVDSGIAYTAERTMFSFRYQRGYTSAIGLSTLLNSDIFSGELGYRVIRWMSATAMSYYYRNSRPGGGRLETVSVGGGLQFTLRRNLFASVNSFLQHQETRNPTVQGLDVDRYSAYVGLQYVWPSFRGTH